MNTVAPEKLVLEEYRCYSNGHLLCRAAGDLQMEIINPTNRVLNYVGPGRESQDIGPKGIDFAQVCFDLNCTNKKCKRLCGKVVGTNGVVEIRCRYCKTTSTWDVAKLIRRTLDPLHARAKLEFKHQRVQGVH